METRISDLLKDLGIQPHMLGYKYLRRAIQYILDDFDKASEITKLYKIIGDEYRTSSGSVERAIRHAIETSWQKGDLPLTDKLFRLTKRRPTNTHYIAAIADYMLIYLKE